MAPAQTMRALKAGFNNLTPGAPIAVAKHSPVLFTKFDRPSGEQKESLEDAKKKKKEKQLKNSKKAAKGGAKGGGKNNAKGGGSDPNQDLFTKINLRVGVIEDIQLHASADKLYVETINIGEESGPRQIVSGLRLHYPDMASLKGRKVVVVANLKKANLVGVASNGMVSVGPVFVATTVVALLSCLWYTWSLTATFLLFWVLVIFFFSYFAGVVCRGQRWVHEVQFHNTLVVLMHEVQ